MPYLEVAKSNYSEEDEIKKIIVPDIVGLSISEAEKILKENNLNLDLYNYADSSTNDSIIREQIPIPGVEVIEGSSIIIK